MEDRSFYVYAHYRLDTMEPFYIGKGREGRANKLNRNSLHDNISKKHGHAVVILYDNLTEEEAFFYEREVIEDLVYEEGYEIYCNNIEVTKQYSYLTNFTFGGEGQTGFKQSKETIEKISKSRKQTWINQSKEEKEEYSKIISNANKNRYKDPKERKKTGEAAIKTWNKKTEKEKKEWAEFYSGENNYGIRGVFCKELNKVFTYTKLAEMYCTNILNIKQNKSNLRCVCIGVRKSSGNYNGQKLTWKYIEDVDEETLDKAEYIDSKKYEELLSKNVNDCK